MLQSSTNVKKDPCLVLTAEDLNGLNRCVFEWADSYDKKDWARLARNASPELYIDYTALGLQCWQKMSAAEYVAMCSDRNFLGNPAVMCQHLIGGSFFDKVSEHEAEGRHQIRAAHQVYTDGTRTTVKLVGHAHASNVHWYRRIEGVWKLAGVKPEVLWSEGNFDGVWKAAREATTAVTSQ